MGSDSVFPLPGLLFGFGCLLILFGPEFERVFFLGFERNGFKKGFSNFTAVVEFPKFPVTQRLKLIHTGGVSRPTNHFFTGIPGRLQRFVFGKPGFGFALPLWACGGARERAGEKSPGRFWRQRAGCKMPTRPVGDPQVDKAG